MAVVSLPADATLADMLAASQNESLKASFTSPEMSEYISHITSMSLGDIVQEPTKLSSEASQLANSLTSLCHTEYSTFLSLYRTSSLLSTTFDSFSESITSLLASVPALESQAREFVEETKEIQVERRKAAAVLEQHDKLIDILELPQLIDTCVRNGYYQEAMDLAAHAAGLAQRFPEAAVVRDVDAEASHAMRLMLAQLLAILRAPVKLPALFKAVGFLRKAGGLEEPALALVFLTSRRTHLDAVLSAARVGADADADAARHIRRFIEAWREGVHDAVTQYTTIFLERGPTGPAAAQLRTLLAAFAHEALGELRRVLAAGLPRVDDPAALTSLLTQLTYCGASFARIGLDFRSILPPLFEAAVQNTVGHAFDAAARTFTGTIADAQKHSRPPAQWLAASAAVAGAESALLAAPQPVHVPPAALAAFPPLAAYTNALLTALNSLRLLAPVALLPTLAAMLDTSLARAAAGLLGHVQAATGGSGEEARMLRVAGRVFVAALVPFVRRALAEGVYGSQEGVGKSKNLADILSRWDIWLGAGDKDGVDD